MFCHNACTDTNVFQFQVYSQEGTHICESSINLLNNKTEYGGLSEFCFNNSNLYGLLELKNAEYYGLRLIKVTLE